MSRLVVFLVNFSLTDSIKLRLKDSGYAVLSDVWPDKKRFSDSDDYLCSVYVRTGRKIAGLLCKIHKIDYPESFWEIPMSGWLMQYIQALYDRYSRLKHAVRTYGLNDVTLLACGYSIIPPTNFFEFMRETSIKEWSASSFYADVARQMAIEVLEFPLPNDLVDKGRVAKKERQEFLKPFFQRAYNKLRDELLTPIPLALCRGNRLLMVPYTFNKREKFIFCKELQARFFKGNKIKSRPKAIDRSPLLSLAADDEFEKVVIGLLPKFMPKYLLEEFEQYHLASLQWSGFKAYFAVNHWYSDILFSYAASLGRLHNAKIIGCQHGGGYGQFERASNEFLERKFSDYFITWGWSDSLYKGARLLPLPQPGLSRNLNTHKGTYATALWVGTTMPKQVVRCASYTPDTLFYYLDCKKNFLSALDKAVRERLRYRPHPEDFGWSKEEEEIFKNYPEVKFIKQGRLSEVSKNASLYICDHQSTSFMQALASNIPTILFWPKELRSERDTAVTKFNFLRESGILFHDGKAAAMQVNRIWADPQGWWKEPKRQNARLEFMNSFCKSSPDWQKEWIKAFRENRIA